MTYFDIETIAIHLSISVSILPETKNGFALRPLFYAPAEFAPRVAIPGPDPGNMTGPLPVLSLPSSRTYFWAWKR